MNAPRLTDAQISEALRAHVPDRADAGLRQRVMATVRTTTQQRRMLSFLPGAIALPALLGTGRSRMGRGSWVLVAAALLALLAAAAIFIGGQRGPLLATLPDPTTTASPTTTATPTAAVSPTPAVASTKLTWAKVDLVGISPNIAWIGDQFVMVDEDSGTVSTSTDGASWHVLQPGDPNDPGYLERLKGSFVSWQDDVVGWWNPEEDTAGFSNQPPITARDILRISQPPAATTVTTPWKGRINSIGIGPKGIVAQVHSHLDLDLWVASKLGDDWGSRYEEVSFKGGILEIKMKQGRGLKVVWADEGFELGDFGDAGFGWYSPDGQHWTQMPVPSWSPDQDFGLGFLTGFGDVVGVSDGFIARGIDTEESCESERGCAGIWHSSDGVTWRYLGTMPGRYDGSVLAWMGGALVTDGVERFDFWTSDGSTELPMAEEIRAAWDQPKPESRLESGFGTGPLGVVTVRTDDREVLVSRDGVDSDIQPMPAAMAADQTSFRRGPSVIVGERSVLVAMWSGMLISELTPSFWLGTLEP